MQFAKCWMMHIVEVLLWLREQLLVTVTAVFLLICFVSFYFSCIKKFLMKYANSPNGLCQLFAIGALSEYYS